ncbi:MAG: sialidase family protein [Candidatus Hermodarchaeota archaeon]
MSTLLFDNSTDYGNTFGKDKDFIPEYNASWSMRNPENGRSAKHTIAITEQDPVTGRLYVAWADVSTNISDPNNSWDVYLRYSDDKGTTWSNITRVNDNVNANQWNPDIELDSQGNLHFVYYDESSIEGRHIKHRIFFPDTNEFSSESQVTTEPSSPEFTRPGEYMSIRFDSEDCPHIVWTDARNNELDIFYAQGCIQLPTQTSSQTNTSTQTPFESIPFILGTLVVVAIVIKTKRKQSL